jgi:hypothetical protein
LDHIPANAQAALSIFDLLPKSRETRITFLEQLLFAERKQMEDDRRRYQEFLNGRADDRTLDDAAETARAMALANAYCQVSIDLGRVTLVVGMLRRLIE